MRVGRNQRISRVLRDETRVQVFVNAQIYMCVTTCQTLFSKQVEDGRNFGEGNDWAEREMREDIEPLTKICQEPIPVGVVRTNLISTRV